MKRLPSNFYLICLTENERRMFPVTCIEVIAHHSCHSWVNCTISVTLEEKIITE